MRVNIKAKLLTLLLCLSIMFACTITAFGATEKEGSISVSFKIENTKLELYKIGDIGNDGAKLSAQFEKYRVDMNCESAADTLAAYIKRDKITPYKTARINTTGEAVFNNLKKGVYLVVGENFVKDSCSYVMKPFIVSLPYAYATGYDWSLNTEAKYEVDLDNDGQCDINTVKIWRDRVIGRDYPDIEVQLLRNYEVYDTAILNEENNWTYEWKDLDESYNWKIVEANVPSRYRVAVEVEGALHTITNTAVDTPTEPTTPTDTTEPTVPTDTQPTQPSTVPNDDLLTQTGQLNWPIPVLVCCGAVFIILGVAVMRKKQ